MDIEEYIGKNYPDIMLEYTRYLNRHSLPEVGSRVVTLRAGFGGGSGLVRTVEAVDGTYIHLSGGGYNYLCRVDEWYKALALLK